MRVFIGIDPGVGDPPGGMVVISDDPARGVDLYPWVTAKTMWERFRELTLDGITAVIEQVTRPRKLVENAGVWKGLLTAAGVPFKEVTPKTWQKHYGQFPKDKKLRKQRLLEIAQQRYPDVDIPLNLADAVLLADYAREQAMVDMLGYRLEDPDEITYGAALKLEALNWAQWRGGEN